MNITAPHPVLEYVTDQEILKFGNKPLQLCEHFGIPTSRVEGVSEIKVGRSTTFEYQCNSFKRVELVAKRFYENQGYEVSWSEGAALVLLRMAINGAIARRTADLFEVTPFDEHSPPESYSGLASEHRERMLADHQKRESAFEERSTATYKLIRMHLREVMLGEQSSPKALAENDGSTSQVGLTKFPFWNQPVKMIESPETVRERVLLAYENINEQPPLDELVEHMQNFIKQQQERYSAPNLKYRIANYSEWTVAFARRLIEVLGLRSFNSELIPVQVDPFLCMEGFDLTVLDVKNKSLRFVEVKNTDSFTPFQLVSIQEWIDMAPSIRPPFEVCLVQTA